MTRKVVERIGWPGRHWVGDGFPVRTLFSYSSHGKELSPFLLFDRAGPAEFAPGSHPRGVGRHPHRGFETVTLVYAGEVSHRDSAGHGGTIGPGDLQWMTAGSGVVHEEFHSEAFTRAGGTLDMVQLWVNLPARDKRTAPAYQAIVDAEIPRLAVAGGSGRMRVIAGELDGVMGPAQTFTPVMLRDLELEPGARGPIPIPEGWNAAVISLAGRAKVGGALIGEESSGVVLDRAGGSIEVEAEGKARLLVLGGEPIHEPIAGYGPFVMNTRREIEEAIEDYEAGRFG